MMQKTAVFEGTEERQGTPGFTLMLTEEDQPVQRLAELYKSRPAFKQFVDKAGVEMGEHDSEDILQIADGSGAIKMMATYGAEIMQAYQLWQKRVLDFNDELRLEDWFEPDGKRKPDSPSIESFTFEEWITEEGGTISKHGFMLLVMIAYAMTTEPVEVFFEYDNGEHAHIMWIRFPEDPLEAAKPLYTGYYVQ